MIKFSIGLKKNALRNVIIYCCLIIVAIIALGAYELNTFTPYLTVTVFAAVIIAVSFGKVSESHYPFCIWFISASMVLGTTMLGHHIVGSDIHGEYFIANREFNIDYVHVNNTSAALTMLCPSLEKLGIDLVWQFKLLIPLMYSFVPVILYFAFKNQISKQKAFYAAIFFMTIPMFSMEITQIVKSMVAQIFLAGLVYFLSTKDMPKNSKMFYVAFCIVAALIFHYTIGIVCLILLFLMFVILVFGKLIRHKAFITDYLGNKRVIVIGVTAGMVFVIWFSSIGSGFMLTYYKDILLNVKTNVENPSGGILTGDTVNHGNTYYLDDQEPLVRTALGRDFSTSSDWGKGFRLIQYLTQLLIIIGAASLIFRWRKYNFTPEFMAGIGASAALILLVLFLPSFSSIINASRFYNIALFFVAPMFIIGIDQVWNVRLKFRQ